MSLLDSIRNWIYDMITRSGIVLTLMPVLAPLLRRLFLRDSNCNHVIRDDGGSTIRATRVNGKVYPPFGVKKIKSIPDFSIREADVLLCGYPKTGCHWTYEIMHMLVTGKAQLSKYGKEIGGFIEAIDHIVLDSVPSPRVLNSHLSYEDLPKGIKSRKTKIVFTMRNPKDTAVSYYNHNKGLKQIYNYNGEFNNYFKLFLSGDLEYGSYFDHTLSWSQQIQKQHDNAILLVSYEEIKSDPVGCVKRVAKFLDISITEQFAQDIVEASNFKRMKSARSKVDPQLFRKGMVGDWRNWLTDAQSQAVDQIWKEKMMGCIYQPQY